MLDIKLIRQEKTSIEAKLKTKDASISLDSVLSLDTESRAIRTKVELLQAKKNKIAQDIAILSRSKESNTDKINSLKEESQVISVDMLELEKNLLIKEQELNLELSCIPNIPFDDVKVSYDKDENEIIKIVGDKPSFNFTPKHHLELNEKLDLFNFEAATKMSGSGWASYKKYGALLELALINFMIETQVKNGFELWFLPLVVKPSTMYASGQLPKFKDQLYSIGADNEDESGYLIPTSEVTLNALKINEIIPENQLPLKYTSFSPCFRKEAGAAGSKERGLIRIHQFHKVEMFAFTKPEESEQMFQSMLDSAEEILNALGLHYRLSKLVTGDMSFSSAKTVDVEVWLPGQDRYYEVSSISNCTDYQSRRSAIRFKKGNNKPELVHTLNGSGLATPRLLTAILENNQQEDGSVILPEVLAKRVGISKLTPNA